jgi:DNA polymerase III alpha subunit
MQQGLPQPKEIIEKAKQLSQPAVAITDFNAGYGLLEFYEKAQDIKPILGAHMLFSYD